MWFAETPWESNTLYSIWMLPPKNSHQKVIKYRYRVSKVVLQRDDIIYEELT